MANEVYYIAFNGGGGEGETFFEKYIPLCQPGKDG